MRARPLVATLRRLDKVESTLFTDDGALRGGVMKVPPILGLDEWQRAAMPVLSALAAAAKDDIDRTEASLKLPAPAARALPPLPPEGMTR